MNRWLRRIGIGGALTVAGGVAIHIASEVRVARERAAHARSDGALYRVTEGAGRVTVFVPGFLGTTSWYEERFADLASDRRLVYVDPIGFGRSPWPAIEYDLDTHLSALEETIEQERAGAPVTIVGHSFGALLAAYYAARHPQRVEHALLLGVPIFEDEEDARTRIANLAPLARAFVLNETIAAAGCDVVCALRPLARRVMPMVEPDLPPRVASDTMLHTWPSFRGTLMNVLVARRARTAVMELGTKATLMHAADDEVSPQTRARRLADDAGAAFIGVDGGHQAYVEPARAWLRAQPSTSPEAPAAGDVAGDKGRAGADER